MSAAADILTSALVLAATAGATLSVAGLVRLPQAYGKVHAVTAGMVLGPLLLLLATVPRGDGSLMLHAVLVGGFLIATTLIAAHALVRLAKCRGERRQETHRR